MTPSQTSGLVEAATQLHDLKASQRYALDIASALVDRLPFLALDVYTTRSPRSFCGKWGVQVHVHAVNAGYFPSLLAELGGEIRTQVESSGIGWVSKVEMLIGQFSGVPFEIRAHLGSQKVEAAA
jgi:hypothetical protein